MKSNERVKSRANRLPACKIDRRGNDSCRFDGIGFTNRFLVCRIANTNDESTLVGCSGQPSKNHTILRLLPRVFKNILPIERELEKEP